jgi:hypothetical protein
MSREMRVSSRWISRGRFTLGVLLVWGAASLALELARSLLRGDPTSSRLVAGQFCTVSDFMSSNILAPTPCYIFDREYQINPSLNSSDHLFNSSVDMDKFVMIENDWSQSSVITDRCARRIKFPGASTRPVQRRNGPDEASAAGVRRRGRAPGVVRPGPGTPGCASRRPSGDANPPRPGG